MLEEEADLILEAYARNGTIELPRGSDDERPTVASTGNSNEPVDIEAMLSGLDDDDDEMEVEEGYSFVIDKGLIKTVPTSYGSLAVPIPFRRQSVSQPKTIAPNRTADTAEESHDEDDESVNEVER